MRNLTTWMLVVVAAVVLLDAPVFAASPWTTEPTYIEKTAKKLEFGLKNALLGWTEIGSETVEYKNSGKNAFQGMAVGLGEAIVYTVGGVLHVATFPIPLDIPLPENGVQIGAKAAASSTT